MIGSLIGIDSLWDVLFSVDATGILRNNAPKVYGQTLEKENQAPLPAL